MQNIQEDIFKYLIYTHIEEFFIGSCYFSAKEKASGLLLLKYCKAK
jgi:hypothetical protein